MWVWVCVWVWGAGKGARADINIANHTYLHTQATRSQRLILIIRSYSVSSSMCIWPTAPWCHVYLPCPCTSLLLSVCQHSKTNEADSAALAGELLTAAGLPPATVLKVCLCGSGGSASSAMGSELLCGGLPVASGGGQDHCLCHAAAEQQLQAWQWLAAVYCSDRLSAL